MNLTLSAEALTRDALFAAAVLLSVGIWMHQKSLAGRWQQYLHAKLSAALTRRSCSTRATPRCSSAGRFADSDRWAT